MSKATRQLIDEHGGIMLMLSILEKVSQKLATGEEVDTNQLNQISEFLTVFVDQCHHGKEERYLFPAIKNIADFPEAGLVDELLQEHDQGRQEARQLITIFRDPSLYDSNIFTSYVNLLRTHIDKENNRLFPLSAQMIEDSEQERLESGYNQIEEEIGPGKHEQIHHLLDELKGHYLYE